jgi:hypothetical protein
MAVCGCASYCSLHNHVCSLLLLVQAPDLTLVPAVAAPGAYIQVKTMTNDATYVSGTSFSSPYTAGGAKARCCKLSRQANMSVLHMLRGLHAHAALIELHNLSTQHLMGLKLVSGYGSIK